MLRLLSPGACALQMLFGLACLTDATPADDRGGGGERGASDDDDAPDRDAARVPLRGARAGRLTGTIGPVRDLDVDADRVLTWDDGRFVSVEAIVTLPERVVMTYAAITRADDVFVPGLHATFRLDERSLDQASLVLLGCAGRAVNVYDEYDAPAAEVDVEVGDVLVDPASGAPVEDDAGALDVRLTGRWRDDETGTTAEASTTFRIVR